MGKGGTMKIVVPNRIKAEFFTFLDIAQASYAESDKKNFSDPEMQCFKFILDLLDKHAGGPTKGANGWRDRL